MSPCKMNGDCSAVEEEPVFTFDHAKEGNHGYVNIGPAPLRVSRVRDRSASSSTSSNSVDTVINANDDINITPTSSSVGSAQASHRVLIGTGMMRRKSSPAKHNNYVNVPAISNNTTTMTTANNKCTVTNSSALRRDAQILRLSTLRQQLKNLLRSESDFQQALSVERSLLLAESEAEQKLLQKGEMRLRALNERLTSLPTGERALRVVELARSLEEKRSAFAEQEAILKRLRAEEGKKSDSESRQRLQEQIMELDALRKAYEDVEFSHMEETAQMSVEKEELNKEISDLRLTVRSHELKIEGFGSQLQQMLHELQVCSNDVARRRTALETAINRESENLACMERVQSSVQRDYVNLEGERMLRSSSSSEEEERAREETKASKLITDELNMSLEKDLHRLSIVTESNRTASMSLDQSTISAFTEDGSDSSSSFSIIQSMEKNGKLACKAAGRAKAQSTITLRAEVPKSIVQSSTTPRRRRGPLVAKPERPLTRYLPITSPNFDLRAHIESAGHPLDNMSELVLNASACRGYLRKLNCNGVKRWQKRWFVFDRHRRVFVYYRDKSEQRPREIVDFNTIEDVYVDHLDGCRRRFCVKTTRRTFALMARTPELMRVWVDVVFTGAEAYQQRIWIPQ